MCRELRRLVYERDDEGFYDEPVYNDEDYTDSSCINDLRALGWSAADAKDFCSDEEV
jgi:hypothetical protein